MLQGLAASSGIRCIDALMPAALGVHVKKRHSQMTAVGFEPTPFRNGALSHRLRPLGQTVLSTHGRQGLSPQNPFNACSTKPHLLSHCPPCLSADQESPSKRKEETPHKPNKEAKGTTTIGQHIAAFKMHAAKLWLN